MLGVPSNRHNHDEVTVRFCNVVVQNYIDFFFFHMVHLGSIWHEDDADEMPTSSHHTEHPTWGVRRHLKSLMSRESLKPEVDFDGKDPDVSIYIWLAFWDSTRQNEYTWSLKFDYHWRKR